MRVEQLVRPCRDSSRGARRPWRNLRDGKAGRRRCPARTSRWMRRRAACRAPRRSPRAATRRRSRAAASRAASRAAATRLRRAIERASAKPASLAADAGDRQPDAGQRRASPCTARWSMPRRSAGRTPRAMIALTVRQIVRRRRARSSVRLQRRAHAARARRASWRRARGHRSGGAAARRSSAGSSSASAARGRLRADRAIGSSAARWRTPLPIAGTPSERGQRRGGRAATRSGAVAASGGAVNACMKTSPCPPSSTTASWRERRIGGEAGRGDQRAATNSRSTSAPQPIASPRAAARPTRTPVKLPGPTSTRMRVGAAAVRAARRSSASAARHGRARPLRARSAITAPPSDQRDRAGGGRGFDDERAQACQAIVG